MINHVKKGDTVKVLGGKDKGKVGKVLKSFPSEMKVLVEGVNMFKKHVKPTQNKKGSTIEIQKPIFASKVKLVEAGVVEKNEKKEKKVKEVKAPKVEKETKEKKGAAKKTAKKAK
jgi:large subunit ribosomal protein L24